MYQYNCLSIEYMYLANDSVGAAKLVVATQPKGTSRSRLNNLGHDEEIPSTYLSNFLSCKAKTPNNIDRYKQTHIQILHWKKQIME